MKLLLTFLFAACGAAVPPAASTAATCGTKTCAAGEICIELSIPSGTRQAAESSTTQYRCSQVPETRDDYECSQVEDGKQTCTPRVGPG